MPHWPNCEKRHGINEYIVQMRISLSELVSEWSNPQFFLNHGDRSIVACHRIYPKLHPIKNHNDLDDNTGDIMFTFSKMQNKRMANTLENCLRLQKFLAVWASASVLSNAHTESASLGKSAASGILTITKSHYWNKSYEFLLEKHSDLTPNGCQDSVHSVSLPGTVGEISFQV